MWPHPPATAMPNHRYVHCALQGEADTVMYAQFGEYILNNDIS